jgi:hypothetical protein
MPERDEKYWRERAKELKSRAATINNLEPKAELLELAERYERLAQRTAGRSAKRQKEQADC